MAERVKYKLEFENDDGIWEEYEFDNYQLAAEVAGRLARSRWIIREVKR